MPFWGNGSPLQHRDPTLNSGIFNVTAPEPIDAGLGGRFCFTTTKGP
jgi:hypothetical protein